MGQTKDPARYRKMSEPHASADAFNESWLPFFEELGELRVKHHLRDVTVIVSGIVKTSDGDEGEVLTYGHIGDATVAERHAAYTYGSASRERQELTTKLMKGSRK